MSRCLPTIVVTSLAALGLGLSACSNTIPATPSPADSVAPGLTQSTGDATGANSDLASKLLVGQVAGATLTQVQVHEDATSPFPDLENPYYDSDADHKIEPAGCEATGIEQLLVGSEGKTENEGVRVALGTGTSSPRKHKDYANKCTEITNHLTETPTRDSIQTQQIPAIDGVIDVVATKTQHGFVGTEGDAGFSTYLITGNVGNINVTVQTYPSQADASTGKEASLDTAVKIFNAQVKKLKGSSGSAEDSTAPSQTPPASSQESSTPSQNTSNQDLSSKLINGSVAGFSLAPMESSARSRQSPTPSTRPRSTSSTPTDATRPASTTSPREPRAPTAPYTPGSRWGPTPPPPRSTSSTRRSAPRSPDPSTGKPSSSPSRWRKPPWLKAPTTLWRPR